MQKLLKLFEELNRYLQIYSHAYTEFRTQALKEDIESKKKAAIEQELLNALTEFKKSGI